MAAGMVSLMVDGRPVSVPAGASLLDAARAAGARLPTLCFEGRLAPEEACRLCLVELEGQSRPVASCALPALEGMSVRTSGPELEEDRRALFDLLLADHYGDCVAPCSQRCPAGIDVQGYIALIARGRYLEAVRLIRRKNPLPLTCGRVCPHPCEEQCRRARVDQPVGINHLKRFAGDIAYQTPELLNPPGALSSGRRVAVVGGGPAGLSAAYFLALAGHRPVIFEANRLLGGMLRYGIPEYRLPKAVLDREIAAILAAGVETRLGAVWGRDFSLESLRRDFDAVFIGTGASVNRELEFIPEGLQGVNYGTCFLGQVALGQETGVRGRVAVIGGGNTAMDCARTALRLGAEKVTVFYRRSRGEMPARAVEVEEAEQEGVEFEFCVAPVAMTESDGSLTGLGFVRMDLCELDASGRATPKPLPGSEFEAPLEYAIVAVGQTVDEAVLGGDRLARQLARGRGGAVKADYLSGLTGMDGVFAAGDLVSGPATVVEAIGGGRRAAEAIDRWLCGGEPRPPLPFVHSKGTLSQVDASNFEGRQTVAREPMPVREASTRVRDFSEVEQGIGEETARAEARRCLACGCLAAHSCRLREVAEELGLSGLHPNPAPARPWRPPAAPAPILIEDGKCIVCRRCQRACADYHGREAVSVSVDRAEELGRFREHRVEINERCDACGLCASLCPTGALTCRHPFDQPDALELEWRESLCLLCPLACRLRAGVLGGHLARIEGSETPPALGHLCRRARFELVACRASAERLAAPRLHGPVWSGPVDWDRAFEAATRGLLALRREHGGESLAGLTTGHASQEELYLFGKLMRLGLGSNHLDYLDPSREHPQGGRLLAGLPAGVGLFSYQELAAMDAVILVGSGLSGDIPLLESALHRMRASGGRLVLLGRDSELAARADLHRELAMGPALELASELLSRPHGAGGEGPGLGAAVQVLVAEAQVEPADLSALTALAHAAASRPGARFGLAPAAPSLLGLRRAGIGPDHYPGHRPLTPGSRAVMERVSERPLPVAPGLSADGILEAALDGRVRGLVLLAGHLPAERPPSRRLLAALEAARTSVVLTTMDGPLARSASVALPWPMILEASGTYRGLDGTAREVRAALPPPPGVHPGLAVLARLLRELGGPLGAADVLEAQSEMIIIDQFFAEENP